MSIFQSPSFKGHEEVLFCHDRESGLKAIVAIHDTTLGPALGGCRMWPFATEQEAIEDVLRLSRGMTYKSAMAGLPYGGGKAVIIGDARTGKTPALLEAFGRFVDGLGGRYITAEDVGTSPADMDIVRRRTRHVVGVAGGSGDPSPATAWGVFHGIRAAARQRLGDDDLTGVRVAIQGLGHVGIALAGFLHEAGARLIVSDIDPHRVRDAVQRFGAEAVEPEAVYDVQAEIFAPCALGAVLNDNTVRRLRVRAVAGSANNQLAEDRHGEALRQRGILYAPDYVINAGGIINISYEGVRYDKEAAFAHCARIGGTLDDLFARAESEGIATNVMADRLAEQRIAEARARNLGRAALRAVGGS